MGGGECVAQVDREADENDPRCCRHSVRSLKTVDVLLEDTLRHPVIRELLGILLDLVEPRVPTSLDSAL